MRTLRCTDTRAGPPGRRGTDLLPVLLQDRPPRRQLQQVVAVELQPVPRRRRAPDELDTRAIHWKGGGRDPWELEGLGRERLQELVVVCTQGATRARRAPRPPLARGHARVWRRSHGSATPGARS